FYYSVLVRSPHLKRWSMRFWIIAAIHCFFLVLSNCGFLSATAWNDAIRLGEVNPLTGNLALHGQEIHEGIVLAVEEINSGGGLQGRQVELISRDDQSRPDVALNQTQDLLYREKVVGLLGGYVDSLVGPISSLAARSGTPYVAAASLQKSLTDKKNPFFFRVSSMTGVVQPLGRFLTEVLKPAKVAILYTATPGSTEFAATLKEILENKTIKVPLYEKFRPGTPDFSVLLLKVKGQGVDVIISGGFFPDNLLLARQLREQQIRVKGFIGSWGVAYGKFIRELQTASDGLMGMCAWNPGITQPGTEAASEDFVNKFQKKFGQSPNTTTMHGYTAARALLAAISQVIEKGEPLTGIAISNQLRQLDLVLPMEHLRFQENGDPVDYRQVIVQIQQGALKVVYPPDRATGEWIYPLPAASAN
ncbi:MAG TPA: ABC transporter substrate-binding protein, partial [Thermodesulfobacteriota bacterium]|nr:ABC transporter substrate-binding protein [Thermodesulfobacteriota bacterium]